MQHKLSRVKVMTFPNGSRFVGTTDNVRILRLETSHLRNDGPLQVQLDGQELKDIPAPENRGPLWLKKDNDQWAVTPRPGPQLKGPYRYGAMKSELKHKFMFV